MRFSTRFTAVLLAIGMPFSLLAQTPPTTTLTHDNATRTTSYEINNFNAGGDKFYIFGDGLCSWDSSTVHDHQFRDDGDYESRTYAVDPKTVTPPAITVILDSVNYVNTGVPAGSSAPRLSMGSNPVQVNRSWEAATGYELVLIVSFQHPGTVPGPIDGQIELLLDGSLSYMDNFYAADWVDGPGVYTPLSSGPFGSKVSWDFSGLNPGEVRHVYAEVWVDPGTNKRLDTRAQMLGPNTGCDTPCYDNFRMLRTDKPKDPNEMYVDLECTEAGTPARQTLNYLVDFYNQGTGYAKDAILKIDFNQYLDPNDIVITDSSHPCTFYIDPISGDLTIEFINIMLPGTNQIFPTMMFAPDQCEAFVEFSYCSPAYMAPGIPIQAVTDIYFDAEPPVQTNYVYSWPEPHCFAQTICGYGNEEGGEDDMDRSLPGYSFAFEAFPNPVQEQCQIEVSIPEGEQGVYQITLTDITGKTVKTLGQQTLTPGQHQRFMDTSQLPRGVYFLRLQSGDRMESLKLVKQ
ncbi:MAG: T9SS type A sorting domain-containing protein [Bacteroidetes bacterium]|nr:T9SS type A sorting domain-containing protein [Bacteroidota bacterium]